ncbi:MAG: voltage-dependent potassium channel subunit beta [Flavobacteriia bacterium]|jgi:voltage-dependent potassium channel beta subunit|nr:voltage-dependent potassium channel subunit beta [Flavobacteriia bacterium]NBV92519.1 voltage-dependent potassium channel subunit beta [Flavobacteriia bacterium]NBY40644.1 voltage-dependent potassium channel subunit beta [Flavobacteriia bacterium]
MDYTNLGKTGLQISRLSLGSWLTFGKQIEDNSAELLMQMAYEHGINFFDNAEIYARGMSEIVMGKTLKKMGWSRDTYIVSSKVMFGAGGQMPTQKGLSRKHITEACHQAMERLQVDYLDLYLCHRPDKKTPIEETVWSMHNLIVQGKILYWGTSEWSAQEIMEAHMFAKQNHLIGPVVEQPEYNMFCREKIEVEFSQLYKTVGLGTTIWSPLASGVLTGKYNAAFPENTRLGMDGLDWLKDKNVTEEKIEKVKQLASFAKELGVSLPVLSIAWCLKNPNVSTVILGASKAEQLKENFNALDFQHQLTSEMMTKIEDILQNTPRKPDF